MAKIKYSNNPKNLQSELKELKKIHVVNKNLHEVKQDKLVDYAGEFEMVGNLKVNDQIRQTLISFRNINDYEAYNDAIDQDYDWEDAIFNGYIYKLNTPQFNKVNRSHDGDGCDFTHEIIEYRGNNSFIPTKGYCIVKGVNFLTGEDYKKQFLNFIRNEKRRSSIMTKARFQPFCRAKNINLGYYDGESVFPRLVTERHNALFLYIYHFCLIWKSEGVSFNQVFKELKDKFQKVDNFITEENVYSHFKNEFLRKKNWISFD